MKLYILVRTDIEIPVGKIMAHCVHNSVRSFKNNMYYEDMSPRFNKWWYEFNTTTIVVNGKSIEKIESILYEAMTKGIHTSFVIDDGMNEKICAAIGPITDEEAKVLGIKKLRLYR